MPLGGVVRRAATQQSAAGSGRPGTSPQRPQRCERPAASGRTGCQSRTCGQRLPGNPSSPRPGVVVSCYSSQLIRWEQLPVMGCQNCSTARHPTKQPGRKACGLSAATADASRHEHSSQMQLTHGDASSASAEQHHESSGPPPLLQDSGSTARRCPRWRSGPASTAFLSLMHGSTVGQEQSQPCTSWGQGPTWRAYQPMQQAQPERKASARLASMPGPEACALQQVLMRSGSTQTAQHPRKGDHAPGGRRARRWRSIRGTAAATAASITTLGTAYTTMTVTLVFSDGTHWIRDRPFRGSAGAIRSPGKHWQCCGTAPASVQVDLDCSYASLMRWSSTAARY